MGREWWRAGGVGAAGCGWSGVHTCWIRACQAVVPLLVALAGRGRARAAWARACATVTMAVLQGEAQACIKEKKKAVTPTLPACYSLLAW